MASKADVRVRRIYNEPEDQDGIRVLVLADVLRSRFSGNDSRG